MGRTGWVLLVSLGLASPVVGQEPVRVYTNADLEPLPATTGSSPEPEPVEAGSGWGFVIDFLAEQHARIDADRAYELEGAVLDEAARRTDEAARPRYVLPWNYGYGVWHPPRRACGPVRPAPHVARAPLVVPLHARRPLR